MDLEKKKIFIKKRLRKFSKNNSAGLQKLDLEKKKFLIKKRLRKFSKIILLGYKKWT
jgi:hypothetical protein